MLCHFWYFNVIADLHKDMLLNSIIELKLSKLYDLFVYGLSEPEVDRGII